MPLRIDLHMHTTHSDGFYSPLELIKKANERKLDVISITDHDSVNAIEEATKIGDDFGVNVIPGMEISTDIEDKEGKRPDGTDLPEGAVLKFTYRDRAIKNDDWTRPIAIQEEGVWEPENGSWSYEGTTACGLVTHIANDMILNYGFTDPDINGFVKFVDVGDDQHEQNGQGWLVAPDSYLGDWSQYSTLSWSQKTPGGRCS